MLPLSRRRALAVIAICLATSACATAPEAPPAGPPLYPNETPELRALINEYADLYEVPRPLVHRLAIRESTHRPAAVNRPYYGLLQILPATARSMGFKGKPKDLLDAETNLKYAGKYLRGAWLISDGSYDNAVKHYSRGYWHEAKRRGMLVETGLVQQ
ncbi:lytic transglycosylase domain-containing protein [Sedimentitalea todarodis]|uniref:Lytic transglycosylase domain-containing protein n=1 Tax=Sedimentitalea todarodis TaxID=1631240 RepID=A0ABU3VCM5_9RHOB|nr:lytic transglycosylase domain-containing protein [Sedimentitalea todarodis]MDU9003917.1 lytic transglycosylase domain-containing protein [Sedimentitalea todarodis]